ncbi:MAG: class I SAM-dependent methyltransferase [Candidatus Thorarchaeota archaeon]
MDEFFDANRDLWDAKVDIHKDSEFYNVRGFLEGEDALDPMEIEEVGDVKGKSLLHLQCHFGLDTMSWERRGAKAVGVDFSGEAIKLARTLATKTGLNTKFVESNIFDLPKHLSGEFDIVYTSGGAIMWLNDLQRWAEIIDLFLKPSGFFYIREFHPFGYIFDDECEEPVLKVRYPYFQGKEPISYIADSTYSNPEKKLEPKKAYEWNHSISRIINVLTGVGLRIEFFNEFPFTTYQALPFMTKNSEGRYILPEGMVAIPWLFSLKASKP